MGGGDMVAFYIEQSALCFMQIKNQHFRRTSVYELKSKTRNKPLISQKQYFKKKNAQIPLILGFFN